jgi:hypothetical protein
MPNKTCPSARAEGADERGGRANTDSWRTALPRADARLAEQAIFNFENSSRTKFANQLQTRTDVNDCSTRKLSLAQLSKRAARICDRWK